MQGTYAHFLTVSTVIQQGRGHKLCMHSRCMEFVVLTLVDLRSDAIELIELACHNLMVAGQTRMDDMKLTRVSQCESSSPC